MLYIDRRDPTKPRIDERIFIDYYIASIDYRLYKASRIIEICRKDLYKVRSILVLLNRKSIA